MSNFRRGHNEKHFGQIILNLGHWIRRSLQIFLFSALVAKIFVQQSKTACAILVEEYFCEIILILNQEFRRRMMSFKDISVLSSGGHFVYLSRNVCAILVEDIMRNISVKLF